MIVGELILKLGVVTSGAGALKQFEDGAKKSAVAATEVDKKAEKTSFSLKNMKGSLEKGYKTFQSFRIGALAVAAALTTLTKMSSNVAAQLLRFEANTGLSAQRLQEWQQQAAASGVAASDLEDSIKGLQQAQTEINTFGGGNQAPWRFLGLNPQEDPFTVLDKLHAKLQEFSPAVGTMWASQLGLSERMIAFVRERKNIAPADKELLLTTREINNLKDFNMYFNRVWDNVKRSIQKFGSAMSPLAAGVTWVFDRLAKALVTIGKGMDAVQSKFKGFKGLLIMIGAGMLIAFLPGWAILAAILVIIEDLVAFSKGEKSLTGKLIDLDDLKNARDALRELRNDFMLLRDDLRTGNVGNTLSRWGNDAFDWLAAHTGKVPDYNVQPGGAGSTVNYVTVNNTINADGKQAGKIGEKIGEGIKTILPQTAPGHQ